MGWRSKEQARRGWGYLFVLMASPALAAGLLGGRPPTRAEGVTDPARLSDGRLEPEGSHWQAPGAVALPAVGNVEWDLGQVERIEAVNLQADNNDDYLLWVSEDGHAFSVAWRAGVHPAPGLRWREGRGLGARARFVRLTGLGGDGRFAVSELELFSTNAAAWVAGLGRSPVPRPLEVWWGLAALAVGVILAAAGARSRAAVQVLAAPLLAGAVVLLLGQTSSAGPVNARQLDWIRAAVAGAALLAVLRGVVFRRLHPAHRGLELGVLAATAGLGLLCFLNLGRPQFFDAGRQQSTWLHHYDLRTYFLVAKYFPELRFDGVYAASAMAVAAERGGVEAVSSLGLRDLRTHVFAAAGTMKDHLLEVRARFTPDRWAAFVADARYFRAAMGDFGFLDSMRDHGGNATPVWLLTARGLFGATRASDGALWLGTGLDVALMLLAFAALGWAFGARTALVGITVFGAMDFYMFGTNWFGSTLRHDWLALWALGLAALKKERWTLAGALLAWSAMIRAFPALTFMTLAVPVGWDAAAALAGRRFEWRAWARRHRGFFQVALAAGVTVVALGAVSTAMLGPNAWPLWFQKVSLLNAGGYINNMSVKNNLSSAAAVVAIALGGVAAVVAVARRAPPHEAAAWGVALLPLLFNPSNYYLHAVFLLVVLGAEGASGPRHPGVWLAMLAMCFASYFTWLSGDVTRHFQLDTLVLLVALGLLWLMRFRETFRRAEASRPPRADAVPAD